MLAAVAAMVTGGDARADTPNHRDFGSLEAIVDALHRGDVDLDDVRTLGLFVFTTPFNAQDGYGDGPLDPAETDPVDLGQRPTLQGNGTLLRVNGLDAQSCNECHSLVSHATRPPTLGIAGVGPAVTNAIILPSVIDVADSTDPRVRPANIGQLPLERDGVADFSGRFANPPFLFGGGAIELLAKEMTRDLCPAVESTSRAWRASVPRTRPDAPPKRCSSSVPSVARERTSACATSIAARCASISASSP
jgi:hypothetical protein